MVRRAELNFNIDDPLGWVEPRLLPGGNEVLVENQGVLELWCLKSGQRIWSAPEDKECFSFDFELTNEGRTLNIASVFSSIEQEGVCVSFRTKDRLGAQWFLALYEYFHTTSTFTAQC